ncbi:MAG: phenylacetic acid degradation operon negative regulatory protein PaaX [Rhodospirillales bacterium]|nr:phenylacetic acid degradation operon negative regulatory protein PaaX [Rhodospirillales bacterium]
MASARKASSPLRAGSLIVTVFGDLVAPRGGEVAYAGLARILAPFGVNDSQLRTALSRLVAEDWLVSERVGRLAYYALAPSGLKRTREAEARIYAAAPPAWNGTWCVALLPDLPPGAREAVRRPLSWLGFGAVGPQTMLHPNPDPAALASLLADLAKPLRPLIVEGPGTAGDAAQALVRQGWDLAALGRGYRGFIDGFAPLARAARKEISPEAALEGRVRLVHEFRRLALRDPGLPGELMPRDWVGGAARRFAGDLYRRLRPASEAWIDANLLDSNGKLPPPSAASRQRFGGDMSRKRVSWR